MPRPPTFLSRVISSCQGAERSVGNVMDYALELVVRGRILAPCAVTPRTNSALAWMLGAPALYENSNGFLSNVLARSTG